MKSRAYAGLALLPGALLAMSAHAGSYLQSGGDVSYSTSLGHIWATEEWDADRNLSGTDCKREYSYNSHHVEYGWSYYHTLFAGTNLAQSRCADDSKEGLSDLRVGIRGRLDLYRNHRAWELEATIPTNRDRDATLRLGCGAFGLAGSVANKEPVTSWVNAGLGAGVQLWESPLASQYTAEAAVSSSFTAWAPWNWNLGLTGRAPFNEDTSAVDPDLSDCSTRGTLVRGTVRLGYAPAENVNLECGYNRALYGEDVSRSQGIYCGFSRLFKP